jgi:hypothetical protein
MSEQKENKIMGNLFEELTDCYSCDDTGVILENDMVMEFCGDCEKGQHLFSEFEIWHNENEIKENA